MCSTFNIVNREDVVVAARKQRSDCAHFVHRGEQLIENAVEALKRDGIALLVVILSAEIRRMGKAWDGKRGGRNIFYSSLALHS